MKKNTIKPKVKGITQKKIDKHCNTYYIDGFSISNNPNLLLDNPFKKDKIVYYIIENANFINGLYLHTDINTHVIFRNCCFHKIVCINSNDSVEFSGNLYCADADFPTFPKYFFNCRCKSLRFTNEVVANASYQKTAENNVVGLNIQAQFLTIDESLIKFREEHEKIKINVQEITMFDSTISAPTIKINSDDIYNLESKIISQNLTITNKNNSELDGIEADNFTYNGEIVEKAKVLSI